MTPSATAVLLYGRSSSGVHVNGRGVAAGGDAPAAPEPDAQSQLPELSPISPIDFRSVLGNFASGVTVVTALEGSTPIGFTCQAFTSLSLDPPMVSFSVSQESRTRPRIHAAGRFCVNVLAADQRELCHAFAAHGTDRFEGVGWRLSPGGSPILDGVLAWVDCTIEAEYPAGDHAIILGNVLHLECAREVPPLVFHRGRFAHCHETDAGVVDCG